MTPLLVGLMLVQTLRWAAAAWCAGFPRRGRQVEQVAHALPLGAQVGEVLRVGVGLEGHAADDLQAEAAQAGVLCRVIGQQPHSALVAYTPLLRSASAR